MTNFRRFQTKRVCIDTLIFDEHREKFSKSLENTVEKEKNCSLQAISPFPTLFSKDMQ